MQLKVNNCGECPFYRESYDACSHPKSDGYVEPEYNIIPDECPLKTSPITIKLNEDESK